MLKIKTESVGQQMTNQQEDYRVINVTLIGNAPDFIAKKNRFTKNTAESPSL